MTFGMTLTEHLTMAASANMFYFAIDYENEPNMKAAAGNVIIKIHQLFFKQRTRNLVGLDTNWLLNNV